MRLEETLRRTGAVLLGCPVGGCLARALEDRNLPVDLLRATAMDAVKLRGRLAPATSTIARSTRVARRRHLLARFPTSITEFLFVVVGNCSVHYLILILRKILGSFTNQRLTSSRRQFKKANVRSATRSARYARGFSLRTCTSRDAISSNVDAFRQ